MSAPQDNNPSFKTLMIVGFSALGAAITFICLIAP